MAVAVEMSFEGPGATLQNYFEAIQKMGEAPEGPHPDPACLFHWVTEHGNGFRVADVWKSQADFQHFADTQIGPVSAAVGLPRPHQQDFIDVANFLT